MAVTNNSLREFIKDNNDEDNNNMVDMSFSNSNSSNYYQYWTTFDVGTAQSDPINIPSMWRLDQEQRDAPIKDFTSDHPVMGITQPITDYPLVENGSTSSVCFRVGSLMYNYTKYVVKDQTVQIPSDHMIEKEYHIEPKIEKAILNYSNKYIKRDIIDTLHLIRVFGITKNELFSIFFKHFIRNFEPFEMLDDHGEDEEPTKRYDNDGYSVGSDHVSVNKPFIGKRSLFTKRVEPMILSNGKLVGKQFLCGWKLTQVKDITRSIPFYMETNTNVS